VKKLVENIFGKIRPSFEKGGKLEKYYYAYDSVETLFFSPDHVTHKGAHVRDANDNKRLMFTVVVALIPALLFGIYNAGYQEFAAAGKLAGAECIDLFLAGALKVVPILLVSYVVGLGLEMFFAVVRGHEVSEGFLVSGLLIALIVPTTIPLWQVAVATAFGVVIGLEVFGGTGMNVLNPALITRAFLFFAYPSQISGDAVWIDGYSGATPLAAASNANTDVVNYLATQGVEGAKFTFENMFYGFTSGSIGETSTLAILIGAVILLLTRVASWRIMLSMALGGLAMGYIFNLAAPNFPANHYLALPPHYHLVMGGFAFGMVFMATEPVTASTTNTGKWIYGFLTGILAVLIRTVNPAYPEGAMLAILLMNVFAPLIDHFVVQANIKRRLARA
jgi:Na+-transporting NADH:ubiquinone oxidoreductase subunit B